MAALDEEERVVLSAVAPPSDDIQVHGHRRARARGNYERRPRANRPKPVAG